MLTIYARTRSQAITLLAFLAMITGGITGCRTLVDAQHELAASSPISTKPTTTTSDSHLQSAASPHDIEAAEAALSSSVIQNDPNAIRPQRVDSRGWYLDSSVPLYLAFHLGEPRWHHRALESLLDQPVSSTEMLAAGTESRDPEIKATALIGLIRSEINVADTDLADLIHNPQVAATTKGALLEAITDATIIMQLFDQRDAIISETESKDDFSAQQLQQQFWYTLATTVPSVRSDERFTANFAEQPAEIQLALLDLMLTDSTCEVPPSVVQRFDNLSPVVLRRINLWHGYLRTVAPIDVLSEGLRSPNFATRESATIGLGREGTRAAETLLLDISDNAPTLIQTAAIVAWGLMPQHEEWPRLAETNSWRVRLAIAQWIPLTSRNLDTIGKLKNDNSHLVRQAILARSASPAEPIVERKPPVKPKPLPKQKLELSSEEVVTLLDQIDQAQHAKDAAARTKAREQLLLAPEKVLAAVEQVAQTLAQYKNDYLFDVLLPQCDPAFQRLQEATQGSSQMTLIALRDLERRSEQAPLHELILWRLSQTPQRFNSLDWQTLMAMIKQDQRPATEALVRYALGHDDPLVRTRACEHVTQFPLPDVIHPLEDSLEHESPEVRCAAIHALSKLDGANQRETFVAMLLDREVDVQLAAAQSLDAANDPRGVQHIYRMTYSSSRETRFKATHAIADRQNLVDLPELIRLLDDETSIRKAAIEGLSSLVPAEDNPPPKNAVISLDAQATAWKNWFDRQSLKR